MRKYWIADESYKAEYDNYDSLVDRSNYYKENDEEEDEKYFSFIMEKYEYYDNVMVEKKNIKYYITFKNLIKDVVIFGKPYFCNNQVVFNDFALKTINTEKITFTFMKEYKKLMKILELYHSSKFGEADRLIMLKYKEIKYICYALKFITNKVNCDSMNNIKKYLSYND